MCNANLQPTIMWNVSFSHTASALYLIKVLRAAHTRQIYYKPGTRWLEQPTRMPCMKLELSGGCKMDRWTKCKRDVSLFVFNWKRRKQNVYMVYIKPAGSIFQPFPRIFNLFRDARCIVANRKFDYCFNNNILALFRLLRDTFRLI